MITCCLMTTSLTLKVPYLIPTLPSQNSGKFRSSISADDHHEGCLEGIRPFWISWEPVAWPWCNMAASQRRPYYASANSNSPMGLVSQQWDGVDWACVLCDCRIDNNWANRSASLRQCACLFYRSRAAFFWQSITSPRSVSPPTGQICLPATSGFSQS